MKSLIKETPKRVQINGIFVAIVDHVARIGQQNKELKILKLWGNQSHGIGMIFFIIEWAI